MPLEIYKRGKVWHYRGTVAGRRLRSSTGTTDKAFAQRIAAEAEAREWRRHLDGPGAELTMSQAFIAYLDADKPDRFILKLAEHFMDTLVRNVTAEAIRQAARKIYPGANPATWNRQVIKPTQAAINHCAELGWCPKISVKRFPEDPQKKVAATAAWVETFADQAANDGLPHLAALAMFMFGTGARVGEACALTWADVDLTAKTAVIRMGKPTVERQPRCPLPTTKMAGFGRCDRFG